MGVVEIVGGDGSKMGLVMKKKGKQKSPTSIGASLIPDYRDKGKSNNNVPFKVSHSLLQPSPYWDSAAQRGNARLPVDS